MSTFNADMGNKMLIMFPFLFAITMLFNVLQWYSWQQTLPFGHSNDTNGQGRRDQYVRRLWEICVCSPLVSHSNRGYPILREPVLRAFGIQKRSNRHFPAIHKVGSCALSS